MTDEQKDRIAIVSGCITGVIIFIVIVVAITCAVKRGRIEDDMRKLAWECYHNETNMVTIVRGHPTTATYVSTEAMIIVNVIVDRPTWFWGKLGGPMRHEKVDLNKSKIVGHYLGKRFKQAKEGFVAGLKEKSKFKETE